MQQPATTQRSPSLVQPQPAQNDHHRPEAEMHDPNLEQLIDVGVTILSQALDLVNDSLTSDEQLTVHSRYMPGSTIGTVLIPRSQHPIDTQPIALSLFLAQANIFATRETTLLSCLTAWPVHTHTFSHMMYGLETPPWRLAVRPRASPLKARWRK